MYNVYYYTNKYIYNEEPYTLDNEAVDYLNTISQASRKLPLFVSDWHFGDVNGSTFIRKYAADELITTCCQNKGFQLISWCAGNWDDNNRCASIWKGPYSHYPYDNTLTAAGNYIKAALQADEPAIPENTFDVNKDKRVNAADVVSVYNYIIIGSQSGITREKANVNGDNDVNAADVVSIYNYIVGS